MCPAAETTTEPTSTPPATHRLNDPRAASPIGLHEHMCHPFPRARDVLTRESDTARTNGTRASTTRISTTEEPRLVMNWLLRSGREIKRCAGGLKVAKVCYGNTCGTLTIQAVSRDFAAFAERERL